MASPTQIRTEKAELIKKVGRSAADTGSPESQVALLTHRINHLTGHFKSFAKDFSSRRGLLGMVGQRKRLLKYLRATDEARYQDLIKKLQLRKQL